VPGTDLPVLPPDQSDTLVNSLITAQLDPVVDLPDPGVRFTVAQALGIPVTPEFIDHIDALFFQETLDHLAPMGDVAALLGQLRVRGYRLGLMTNDADANTRAQLRQLGLDELLEFIAAYDSGYGHKPDPAPVLAFAQFAGLAPDEIAVVGDTEHDLVAARAAGATAVGVLSGPVPRERLAPHADVLLPSIAKLDDWLSSISAKG